jgi:hypothetical protein
MKLTIKKDGNEIVIEGLSIYFKELIELIEFSAKSISK